MEAQAMQPISDALIDPALRSLTVSSAQPASLSLVSQPELNEQPESDTERFRTPMSATPQFERTNPSAAVMENNSAFSDAAKIQFEEYLNAKPKERRRLFDRLKYSQYIIYLTSKTYRNSENRNQYDTARRRFQLVNGQLYRKPEPMKRCSSDPPNTPLRYYAPRRVVCVDNAFETIRRVHEDCGHNGINKTWEALEEEYYGIVKEDVFFNREVRSKVLHTPIFNPTLNDIEDMQIEDDTSDSEEADNNEEEEQSFITILGEALTSPDTQAETRPIDNNQHPTPITLTSTEQQVLPAHARAHERIISKYASNHQIIRFEIGDYATLGLSRSEIPSSTGLPRTPCRILKQVGRQYIVQTKWGVLDHVQATEVLNPLPSYSNLAKTLPPAPSSITSLARVSLPHKYREPVSNALTFGSNASLGLVVETTNGPRLRTVAHLPPLHSKLTNVGYRNVNLGVDSIPPVGLEIYVDSFDGPIARVAETYDSNAIDKDYLKKYEHDLAFLEPTCFISDRG
ncbi:hypothetical protein BJ508DRAFT_321337 [Ascobolus immersus RN42]|uniref:Integrase zinc-binding domain-containing protein n=1 Tax=Ascobolus immersus RN42 TaxID=1160509 RepID=A0A3N4IR97_ASCIM|nr:hypothetical protein BJ508DRAFT_321337 [Ascobolus immersus RN42]